MIPAMQAAWKDSPTRSVKCDGWVGSRNCLQSRPWSASNSPGSTTCSRWKSKIELPVNKVFTLSPQAILPIPCDTSQYKSCDPGLSRRLRLLELFFVSAKATSRVSQSFRFRGSPRICRVLSPLHSWEWACGGRLRTLRTRLESSTQRCASFHLSSRRRVSSWQREQTQYNRGRQELQTLTVTNSQIHNVNETLRTTRPWRDRVCDVLALLTSQDHWLRHGQDSQS